MTPVLRTRAARPSDVAAIAAFTTGTFDWGDYVPESIAGWIDDQSGYVLVATDGDDSPVAIGRATLLTPQEAWLHAARVHPDWRGRGIASQMAVELTDWARDRGGLVARLMIEENNTASIRNINKTAFRKTAVIHRGFRTLGQPAPHLNGNGGSRRRSPLTAREGNRADAELVAAAWSTSEAGRALRGLIAESWSFYRLRRSDVDRAAREARLWEVGSAWAITSEDDGRFNVLMLDTSPTDAPDVIRALVDLATDREASEFSAWAADCPWLVEALMAAGCDTEPSGIYAQAL
ncbi:MAG: GNAT family N-acetyltransferase [Armatimonadetes bacterium]|nr:MAG: GNAT family N-acetyltransferase [Armatimonadota bacterium]